MARGWFERTVDPAHPSTPDSYYGPKFVHQLHNEIPYMSDAEFEQWRADLWEQHDRDVAPLFMLMKLCAVVVIGCFAYGCWEFGSGVAGDPEVQWRAARVSAAFSGEEAMRAADLRHGFMDVNGQGVRIGGGQAGYGYAPQGYQQPPAGYGYPQQAGYGYAPPSYQQPPQGYPQYQQAGYGYQQQQAAPGYW